MLHGESFSELEVVVAGEVWEGGPRAALVTDCGTVAVCSWCGHTQVHPIGRACSPHHTIMASGVLVKTEMYSPVYIPSLTHKAWTYKTLPHGGPVSDLDRAAWLLTGTQKMIERLVLFLSLSALLCGWPIFLSHMSHLYRAAF